MLNHLMSIWEGRLYSGKTKFTGQMSLSSQQMNDKKIKAEGKFVNVKMYNLS